MIGDRTVVDTTAAIYRWDHERYPAFYVPINDLETERFSEAQLWHEPSLPGLVRVDWDAPDAWYEEDEQVFVHPRSPFVRVDALRSNRPLRVEHDGRLLADASSSVMVFETGLPTRYYIDRTAVRWDHLRASATQTACPYKGRTSSYWSVLTEDGLETDLAWSYDFPTRQLLPIAGLVAFFNERVDITLDHAQLSRPVTHFS